MVRLTCEDACEVVKMSVDRCAVERTRKRERERVRESEGVERERERGRERERMREGGE